MSQALTQSVKDTPSLTFFLVYFLTIGAPTTALIIASYVILALNWDAACDGTMMPLPVWLLVFAIFETLYLIKSAVSAYYRKTDTGSKTLSYGAGINQLFMIIWNIIGAVALFRDSDDCQTALYPLWAMVLAVLIIQWIVMGCFTCLICCACCAGCAGGLGGKKSSGN
jgi:hypothetical protein